MLNDTLTLLHYSLAVASHNRHVARNMQWQAVDQRERGKEQRENQALPSDVPNLAQHEYYDSENQGNNIHF